MSIKVAIDTYPLESGHAARGMGMYARNLIDHLLVYAEKDSSIKIEPFLFKENKTRLKDFDIIHYPYFDLFWHTLAISKPATTIVTIPDLIPLIYPKHYPPGIKGSLNLLLQMLSLRSVSRVITISETSKKDIVRFLNFDASKIDVTYLAPNFKVKKSSTKVLNEIKNKYMLPKEFILYVGDVNWNKNIITLCEAAVSLKKVLVIVGKQAVSKDFDRGHIENSELVLLQDKFSNSKYIKTLGFVENEDLNAIWQLATVYCQPSHYEGFGLPVLEAMDAKVPVLASRTQALVEVGAEACEYFDPYDNKDLQSKLIDLMNNNKRRTMLVKAGEKRVRDFSWKKTAIETISSYKLAYEKE